MKAQRFRIFTGALVALQAGALWLAGTQTAAAMPEFARRYNMSCAACHAAFPRLNKFGEEFAATLVRGLLPDGKRFVPPAAARLQALLNLQGAGN